MEHREARRIRKSTTVLAVGVLAFVGALGLVGVAGAAGQGSNAAPVLVTNLASSPVPVAGTVNVGNLPAAPTTTLLLDTTFGGSGPTSATVAVDAYKTVRLYLSRAFGEGCPFDTSVLTVSLRDTVTNGVIDIFTVGQVNHTMKVYEAPGTSLRISVSGATACTEDVVLWGRAN